MQVYQCMTIVGILLLVLACNTGDDKIHSQLTITFLLYKHGIAYGEVMNDIKSILQRSFVIELALLVSFINLGFMKLSMYHS